MNKDIKNIIAPAALEVNPSYLKLGSKYTKTIFISSYPRYLATGWFSSIINAPELMDVSIFVHPVDTAIALKNLRKKTAQIESQVIERSEKGVVRSPKLETALQDVESLRDSLQQATEHLFNVSVYITIYADSVSELKKLESKINHLLESRLVYSKPATFQQVEAFNTTLPIGEDSLMITTPFNSSPASSFFPFVSATLTSDSGVLQGINLSNNTLVIFDRFSLENANQVIFATSGAGKSYAAKLEALRLLMTGTDVLIIDPENEYKNLAEAVGGSFINISLASKSHINPFDLPIISKDEDPADALRSHIGKDFSKAQPPLLSDLETVLNSLSGGQSLAKRLYRYTQGSYSGFINQPTNVNVRNRLVVFSIRDLEEELRPIAMYIILNFIWNLIKSELKKRVMIVDEAWWMMKYPDGASFMFSLVKRARKYYLGVTTITQDVEDFLRSPYGRPIITNSALQILLKQQPAMIDLLAKTFNLTDSEKNYLLDAPVGEGLFFAGLNHVIIKIVASYLEDQIITTNPKELLNE